MNSMNKFINKSKILIVMLLSLMACNTANADDVKILAAEFKSSGNNQWFVNVTLKHKDAGWEHYADNWRVVDSEGNVLGDRVLYHPHVDEQPFTRGLSSVKIPEGITIVYIEAHDKVHGWTAGRMKLDLSKAVDGQLRIKAE